MSQPTIKAPPFVRYVVYFNGQNSAAAVPPNPAFYSNQLTVVAWFAIISNPNGWDGIVSTGYGNANNWYIMSGKAGVCQAYGGATFTGGATGAGYPVVNCGEVHQYVLVLNGNQVLLYFDGKYYNSDYGHGDFVKDTSLALVIGAEPRGPLTTPPSAFTNIAVWQVLIYNRPLNFAEIGQLYSNPTNPIRDGLVLWLQADPAYVSGNTWLDLSGNNNNATLYNAQLVQLVTPSPSPTISPTLSVAPTPTSPAPSAPKLSPWLWVGVGIAAVVALGAGLYVAYKKGLI